MDPWVDLLRCPACKKGALRAEVPDAEAMRCPECGESYPARDGIVELLGTASGRTLVQGAMELRPVARAYEGRLWRRNPLVWSFLGVPLDREVELVLDAAGLTGSETVLDLACGTGIYARAFAARVPRGRVVGLDRSLPMLEEASRRAQREEHGNLLWVHADAERLPFPPQRFDVVNCAAALHLLGDLAGVLRSVRGHLRPHGRLTCAVFRRADHLLAALTVGLRRRILGVDAFTRRGLEMALSAAGFGWIQCRHEGRNWMVLSAVSRGRS